MWTCGLVLASVVGMISVVGAAAAQTFNVPTYYIWGEYPSTGYVMKTPLVKKFVQLDVYNGEYTPAFQWYYNRPDLLAKRFATEIASEIAAGRITIDPATGHYTVATMLKNWGMDNFECDRAIGVPEPTFNGTRFFQPDDRIPGINEWASQGEPVFPRPRNEGAPLPRGESPDYGMARSYRHPMIQNALPDDGATVRAPLRAYMKTLLTEMNAEYQRRLNDPALPDIPHPSTYKWLWDTEPLFPGPPSTNSIFMLEEISKRDAYWNNPGAVPKNYLWAFRHPDGSPKTFAQLYDEAWQERGWPPEWRYDTGLRAQLDYEEGQNSESFENRDIMQWACSVNDASARYIMDHCMFSVLREFYGPNVECGNYDMFHTDGQPDTTGWFEERAWLGAGSYAASNANWPQWVESEDTYRMRWSKPRGGAMYYLLGGAVGSQRWLRFPTSFAGTAHSPVCYPLGRYELCNDDSVQCGTQDYNWCDNPLSPSNPGGIPNDMPGHKRRTVWQPRDWNNERPFENFHESSLRLHRSNIESIINSGNSNLVPWMQMAGTNANGTRPIPPDQDPNSNPLIGLPGELMDYLRLFRAKNVKTGLFWTGWNAVDHPEFLPNTWEESQRAVARVYANRVLDYTRTQSTVPVGGYTDAGESAATRKTRLEFTLRNSHPNGLGSDRDVNLGSKIVPVLDPTDPPTPDEYQTVLTVDYEWPNTIFDGASFADEYVFEINIECAVKFTSSASVPTQTTGKVLMLSVSGCNGTALVGQWYEVGTYSFNAPKSSDGRYKARALLNGAIVGGIYPSCTSPYPNRSKLRLVHTSDVKFTSLYDLIQLTPVGVISPSNSISMNVPHSDINYDGSVDTTDLTMYIEDWMNEDPGADMDMDTSVSATDLDTFIEAYTNGT